MKILLLSFLFFSITSYSQVPAIDWEKSFGGTQEDYGYTVIIDNDGNIVAGGSALSVDGDISNPQGELDIWIMKYSMNGDLLWKKNYGGSGNDYIWDIHSTNDGGYIFAGNSDSIDGDISENNGASDFWIVKLDTDGNIEWEKTYGGSNFDDLSKITETESGDFVLIGSSFSNDGIFSNNHGNSDIAIVKIDNSGNFLWSQLIGGSGHDFGIDVLINSMDQIIISGFGNSQDGYFSDSLPGTDVLLAAFSPNGLIIWHMIIGGSGSDQTYSMIELSNGRYLVGINSNSTDGDFDNNFGHSDVWLFELEPGLIHQKYHFGGSLSETPMAMHQLVNGDIIVACRSSSIDGDVSNNHGSSDFWIFRMSSDGNIIWENSYGGSEADDVWDMAVSDSTIALVGNTRSGDGDISDHKGLDDMWIVKLSRSDMGIDEYYNSFVNLYPNPVSDKLKIDSQDKISDIKLFSLNGNLLMKYDNNPKELDFLGLSKGIYLLKIKTSDGRTFTKKIVKK